ncbi:tetratricopeptide repeat protein [Streptomyces sporangiiformans]|nr:tetratricopeptide repeat protein [Streptomyces sporangiiformans]
MPQSATQPASQPKSEQPESEQPESKGAPQPESKGVPQPESEPEAQPESKSHGQPVPVPESKPDAQPMPESKPDAQPMPESKPDAQPVPESKPDARPVPKPEARPDPRPASQPRPWPQPASTRRGGAKRGVIASVVLCAVVGGVCTATLREPDESPAARATEARATAAVKAAGAPTTVRLRDLAAVITDREAHLRAHPDDVRAWAVLGSAYVERGERADEATYFPMAEKALRTSLKAKPKGNVEAFHGLAALAEARHDFRAARKWGEAAVAASPKRWTTYPLLIDAYRGLGDHSSAQRALRKLTGLRSGAEVFAQTGLVYRDSGRPEDAAAALSDAVALAATPAEEAAVLLRGGELAWERGEAATSLRYYEAALRAAPGEHAALAGRGRALAALGRTSEALRAYRTALTKRPLPQYALELGELYESLGLDNAARTQYNAIRVQVRKAAAGGINHNLVLGRLEADHGAPASALRLLRAEWERHPSAQVADALGWALHRSGRNDEAISFASKATAEHDGGGMRVALHTYHRGVIERALRQNYAARSHLAKSLRINPHFSPLLAPAAKKALQAMGEPSAGGPQDVYG